MSIERERSPSFRSRPVLVKVSHGSKQLPQDFFLPKPLFSPPKKRESSPLPHAALQKWYESQDNESKKQTHKMPQRGKQSSRIHLINQNQEPNAQKKYEKESYMVHLLETMHKKQSLVFQSFKQVKESKRPKIIERVPTSKDVRKVIRQKIIRSESKPRRKIFNTPQKNPQTTRQERLSMREIRPRGNSQTRYNSMNVGFDGLLTFNRFR